MIQTQDENRQAGEQTKQVKYKMEIYFPEVYDTIEAPLTPEQVQVYSDFIQAEREKYDQSPDKADYDWESWLRDAFLLDANFPILSYWPVKNRLMQKSTLWILSIRLRMATESQFRGRLQCKLQFKV